MMITPMLSRSHNQGNRAVRSNPFHYVVLFDLELKLSFQIPPHNWFLVLKYPSMMAFFAVQHYTNTIEAISDRSHRGRLALAPPARAHTSSILLDRRASPSAPQCTSPEIFR